MMFVMILGVIEEGIESGYRANEEMCTYCVEVDVQVGMRRVQAGDARKGLLILSV